MLYNIALKQILKEYIFIEEKIKLNFFNLAFYNFCIACDYRTAVLNNEYKDLYSDKAA